MNNDVMFVIGLVLAAFSIPPILGALFDGRSPRAAAIVVMVAGGLMALAINNNPGGYSIADIPDVFVSVIGRFMR